MMAKRRAHYPRRTDRRRTGNPNRLLAALPADDYDRSLRRSTSPAQAQKLSSQARRTDSRRLLSRRRVLLDGHGARRRRHGRGCHHRPGRHGRRLRRAGRRARQPQPRWCRARRTPATACRSTRFAARWTGADAFYDLMTRYAQALVGFVMQSTACNAVHSVEQRLARWLLMAQDRMEQRRVSADAGVRRDDARREPPDRDGRRRHAAEGRADHVSPRTCHYRGPPEAEAASCECYRTATNLLNGVTNRARS